MEIYAYTLRFPTILSYHSKRRRIPMKHTFRQVAALCGLRLSCYCTVAFLFLTFLFLVPTRYRTPTPLYIILVLALFPSLLKSMFSNESSKKERDNTLVFPLFCKKYRYDRAMYCSMNLAYLLSFLLFAAWQFSYHRQQELPDFLRCLPSLLCAVSLLIRFLGVVGYRLYFHLFPVRAMHWPFSGTLQTALPAQALHNNSPGWHHSENCFLSCSFCLFKACLHHKLLLPVHLILYHFYIFIFYKATILLPLSMKSGVGIPVWDLA